METVTEAAEAPFWVRYNRERQARERAAKRRLVEALRVEREALGPGRAAGAEVTEA
jgi:hypothetical protein